MRFLNIFAKCKNTPLTDKCTVTGYKRYQPRLLDGFNFAENVPANNTIWILGDNILMQAGGHYEKIKKELKEQTTDESTDNRLYMDKHYAVRIVSPGMYNHANVPSLILNSLVETLNLYAKIPHTMVMVINDRRFWNNKVLLAKEMAWIIKKFWKEFNKIIDARKYALDTKAVNWDYPRVFLTRPLPLPSNLSTQDYPTGFRSNRRKYNRILDKVSSSTNGKLHIMNLASFTSQNKNKLFNLDGSVSEKGYEQFWIEISDAIQKDDDQVRIMMNKLRAKQLAKTMEAELLTSDQSDAEERDTSDELKQDKGNKVPSVVTKITSKSPVRRSLAAAFNQTDTKAAKKSQSASPSQTKRRRRNQDNQDSDRNQNCHRKLPPKNFPGFFKPRRRYHDFNPYFHPYPPPGFHQRPGPGYYQY